MTRLLAVAGATLLSLLVLVPGVLAADPWTRDEHLLISTGGDVTVPPGQHADVLVIVDGTATIEGDVATVLVVNGTANFVGATTEGLVAVSSDVTLDAATVVAGDIRTFDSTIERASGAIVEGSIGDLTGAFANALFAFAVVGILAYLAFAVTAIVAGVALAGLASTQVRRAERIINEEPIMAILASVVGLLAIVATAVVAIVTVVGLPLGLAILIFVLPALLVVGYLVTGIWIGDLILSRTSPGVARERPYLAALVGLVVLAAIGWIPFVGGLLILLGFGAVMLLMWRVLRRDTRSAGYVGHPVASPSAG
jgi:hypothetical protein